MNIFTGVIVYLMIFWTVLFCVLPWGNTRLDNPEKGHAASAPANPRILKKFIVTGLISIGIWIIVYILIDTKAINFHEIARVMQEEENY